MRAAADVREACFHPSLEGNTADVRQCSDCHGIYRRDRRLTSVSKVVGMLPQEPCSQCFWPIYSDHKPGCKVKDNIDNANRRGKEVDGLFSAWVVGKLDRIPAGTGHDSRALFEKLQRWFDAQNFSEVESQILLADDEVGGVCDLRLDGMICDLKCTYDVSQAHEIQVGGYVSLAAFMDRKWPDRAAILHVTERLKEPKLIHLNPERIVANFKTCLSMWHMVNA